MLTKDKTSLSSLVQIGSKRQVDVLDEVSWGGLIGEEYIPSFTAVSKVPLFEDKSVPVEGRRAGGDKFVSNS